MKLDDPFLGKAQVHAFCVLQVEGTLVELGDRVISIQQRGLLVHLSDDLKEIGRQISYLGSMVGGGASIAVTKQPPHRDH